MRCLAIVRTVPNSSEAFFYPRIVLREEIALFHASLRESDIEVWSRISSRLPAALPGKGTGLRDLLHELLEYAVEEGKARAVELRIGWQEEDQRGLMSVEVEFEGTAPGSPGLEERLKGPKGAGLAWESRANGGVATLEPLDLGPRYAPELPPEPTSADEPVRDPAFARRHPYEVLVVDDSDIGRKLTTQILRHLGYDPAQASSGPEALERFDEKHCGLIFMDLRMPGMDGCETVRHILERVEGQEGPKPIVIALTAEISESERQRCLASGMADFLTKPCRPDELAAAIRRAGNREGAGPLPKIDAAPRRRWEDAEMLHPATLRALRMLPGTVKATLLEEMVDSLERETPDTCRLIGSARQTGQDGTVRDLLHRLTGNFEVIGAHQLSRLCRAASEASQRGDGPQLERLLSEIEVRYQIVRTMLAKELES